MAPVDAALIMASLSSAYADTERVLEAVVRALEGESGQFAALPAGLVASIEVLLLASLARLPEELHAPPADVQRVKGIMVEALRMAADRVEAATQTEMIAARCVVRAIAGRVQ